jgi:hypothetical protein
MFYILAEARSYASHSFKAKGKIPFKELSIWARNRRTLYISDCGLNEALQWNKENDCRLHYLGTVKQPLFVDSPDFHTDTWLSFAEYEKALEFYKLETNKKPSADYLAVYAAMKVFEQKNYVTRLVIWFDN